MNMHSVYLQCVICRFSDFLDEIWMLYDNEDTAGHAMSTGWKEVDQFYRVRLTSVMFAPCGSIRSFDKRV